MTELEHAVLKMMCSSISAQIYHNREKITPTPWLFRMFLHRAQKLCKFYQGHGELDQEINTKLIYLALNEEPPEWAWPWSLDHHSPHRRDEALVCISMVLFVFVTPFCVGRIFRKLTFKERWGNIVAAKLNHYVKSSAIHHSYLRKLWKSSFNSALLNTKFTKAALRNIITI